MIACRHSAKRAVMDGGTLSKVYIAGSSTIQSSRMSKKASAEPPGHLRNGIGDHEADSLLTAMPLAMQTIFLSSARQLEQQLRPHDVIIARDEPLAGGMSSVAPEALAGSLGTAECALSATRSNETGNGGG